MHKAENAVQVAKALKDVTNQSVSSQTVRRNLREIGMVVVVKRKCPFLRSRHRRERLQWAERCKDFTLEDWKRVIWSNETKINHLGSDGRVWVYKDVGEESNDRLVKSTVKFGGGNVMDMQPGLKEIWMQSSTLPSWRMNFSNRSNITTNPLPIWSFNRITTLNTRVHRLRSGLMRVDSLL